MRAEARSVSEVKVTLQPKAPNPGCAICHSRYGRLPKQYMRLRNTVWMGAAEAREIVLQNEMVEQREPWPRRNMFQCRLAGWTGKPKLDLLVATGRQTTGLAPV